MKGRTPYRDAKRKVVFSYLEKYPDASTRLLARIVYRDYSAFFSNEEDARANIRVYRGQSGDKLRHTIKLRKYYKHEI